MREKATQLLLHANIVDFWGIEFWSEISSDLNAAESIVAIIKDKVKTFMIRKAGPDQYSRVKLMTNLHSVLEELENNSELFDRIDSKTF